MLIERDGKPVPYGKDGGKVGRWDGKPVLYGKIGWEGGTGNPSPTVRMVGRWDGKPVPYGKDGGKDFLLQYESRGTNNQMYRSSLGYLMGTAIWVM